ncbi:hypothetical protein [Actinoallomurus sp. CA-150999]|uniref:hypothetical protein n=1 Tax=Actinoallomurus sp. CA-150999 TaxID=3239887 RepID=UPI003D91D6A6
MILTVLSAHAAVDPQEVRWLAQYDHYSSHDPTDGETLVEITMAFDGNSYHGDLRGHRLLHVKETAQLLKQLNMAPVPDALLQLGHTDGMWWQHQSRGWVLLRAEVWGGRLQRHARSSRYFLLGG